MYSNGNSWNWSRPSKHSKEYFEIHEVWGGLWYFCLLECCLCWRDHDKALNAEIVGINSFYMDIGLDDYGEARTSKLPNCSNWSRSCSRLGLGQEVFQFSRKESKGWDWKKIPVALLVKIQFLWGRIKNVHKVYSIDI